MKISSKTKVKLNQINEILVTICQAADENVYNDVRKWCEHNEIKYFDQLSQKIIEYPKGTVEYTYVLHHYFKTHNIKVCIANKQYDVDMYISAKIIMWEMWLENRKFIAKIFKRNENIQQNKNSIS